MWYSSVNVISLFPSCPISKTKLIRRVFVRNGQILQKKHCALRSECLYLKYIFIKILLICSQKCSLKYINFYFNNFSRITLVQRLVESDGMTLEKCIFFHISYQFPLIVKILLGIQMYVVTGIEFIFSSLLSLLILSVKIRK